VSAGAHLSRGEADRLVEAAFVRHKRGDLEFAAGTYRKVLASLPDHPGALHYLGLVAQQTGHSKEAAALVERSIALAPRDARAHNHLGQIRVALQDKSAAAECFRRALDIDPNHVDSLNNLANVLKVRDLYQAIALYRRALEINPRMALANFNLANALKENGEFDEAATLFERTLEIDPGHVRARHGLAVLLEQNGKFDAAVEQYLEVRRRDPQHVGSLANLIAIRSYAPDAATVRDAEQLLDAPKVGEDERAKLHHGLGKHYDRAGDYPRAFTHFARSKAIMRQKAPVFDVANVAKSFDRLIQSFPPGAFAGRRARGSDSQRPVFIVGMPRSGTTLTEQILASHPRVFGAGELQDIPRIVKSLRPEYPGNVASMDEAALRELAQQYLAVLSQRGAGEALRVTDKMPVNFTHLGMIATLLPGARIVHCRRDPLDVGLSCFIELFELDHGYTMDLEAFGRYFLQHERLMAHWRAALPMPIHEVRYERLVEEPEAQSRALVAHCGLDWDPACLEFQKTERTVQTPSRWQVRQPVYRTSVGRWRRYEQQLAPLIRVLEEAGYRYER
jgi:tetratricopeptide (TPR) repeat protein